MGCFLAFNIALFKQQLLQLVLWNKQAPLKKHDRDCFPQIDTATFII